MKKRKYLLGILAVAMSFAMASCGESDEDTTTSGSTPQTQQSGTTQTSSTTQAPVINNAYIDKAVALASKGFSLSVELNDETLGLSGSETIAVNSNSVYYGSGMDKWYYKDNGDGTCNVYSKTALETEWTEKKNKAYTSISTISTKNMNGWAEYYLDKSAYIGSLMMVVKTRIDAATKDSATTKFINRDCEVYKFTAYDKEALIYLDKETGVPLYAKYYVNQPDWELVGWVEYKATAFTTPYTLENPVDVIADPTATSTTEEEKFGADSIPTNVPTNVQIKYYEEYHNTQYVFQKVGNNVYRWEQMSDCNADAICYKYNANSKNWSVYQRNYDPTDAWRVSAISSPNKFSSVTFDEEVFFNVNTYSFTSATKTTETAEIAGVRCEKYVQDSALAGKSIMYYSPEYNMIFKKVYNPGESDEHVTEIREITKNISNLVDFIDSPASANPYGAGAPTEGGEGGNTTTSTSNGGGVITIPTEPTQTSIEPTETSTEPIETSTEPTETSTTPVEPPLNEEEWMAAMEIYSYVLQREIYDAEGTVRKVFTVDGDEICLLEYTSNSKNYTIYLDSALDGIIELSNGNWTCNDEYSYDDFDGRAAFGAWYDSYSDFTYNEEKDRFEYTSGLNTFAYYFKEDKSLDIFVIEIGGVTTIEDKITYVGDVTDKLPDYVSAHVHSFYEDDWCDYDDDYHVRTCKICGDVYESHHLGEFVPEGDPLECGGQYGYRECADCGHYVSDTIKGDDCEEGEEIVFFKMTNEVTGVEGKYVGHLCSCCGAIVSYEEYVPELITKSWNSTTEPVDDVEFETADGFIINASSLANDAPVIIYTAKTYIRLENINSKKMTIVIQAEGLGTDLILGCYVNVYYDDGECVTKDYVAYGEDAINRSGSLSYTSKVEIDGEKEISYIDILGSSSGSGDDKIAIYSISVTYDFDAFID